MFIGFHKFVDRVCLSDSTNLLIGFVYWILHICWSGLFIGFHTFVSQVCLSDFTNLLIGFVYRISQIWVHFIIYSNLINSKYGKNECHGETQNLYTEARFQLNVFSRDLSNKFSKIRKFEVVHSWSWDQISMLLFILMPSIAQSNFIMHRSCDWEVNASRQLK